MQLFDIERARQGEQVTTIYGDTVKIIEFNYSEDAPIIAIITYKSRPYTKTIQQFDSKGYALGWYGRQILTMASYGA